MEIVCVRHGRTAWNADRRFQGHSDIPLDEGGRAQARALAAHLARERFDLAYSSDLSRALDTARAIGAACGVEVRADPRLREMRFGIWEGMTWKEIVASTPGLAEHDETSPKVYVPEGGESFEALCERVDDLLDEIVRSLPPAGRALLVSHAGVMHALLAVALAEDDAAGRDVRFVPAGILRLRGDGEAPWTVVALNEAAVPAAGANGRAR